MQIQSLSGMWQFSRAGKDEWLPATVPGSVHLDLLAAGRIPDPFVADNEKRVQWVAESDWEYRRLFTIKSELLKEAELWLVCDGLDTLATVTLNGHLLGQTDNMFRQYEWDVKPWLLTVDATGKPAANELRVQFASPVKFAAEQQAVRALPGVSQAIPGGPYLRKAPCQFGWDWGPQLPPVGIWKDLRLEGRTGARLQQVYLRQEHAGGQVTVEARVAVERLGKVPLTATVRIIAPDSGVVESSAEVAPGDEVKLRVPIAQPQLWWPNGYGRQPLYQVEIRLDYSGSPAEAPLDQRTYPLGLRTIELRQSEDQWGRSFVFVVNGVPVFVKGSNWIPADSFPTRISDKHLDGLIRAAAETHQNMLRVWGGGFYEEERFYDLCDRYGILVWQEFIFSCSIYPLDDPAYLENVRQEVVQNVRRLRHRASLALWCGNNEMEWGWCDWAWKQRSDLNDLKTAYDHFFHRTLPGWCTAEDPDHAYWPSSPSSDTPFENPNGQRQGDAHYWDVWHGRKPFTAYRDQYPRFMSEFGFQALPPLATIRTYADEADWNMTSYIMEQHQKNASGNSLMVGQMLDTFRLPKDFASLVYLSMALQAEGIRYGVEHWRRHVDRVGGTLYWQLNDCWPVASWSSLDYFGRWKALHYAARRFYAPVMLSIEDTPPQQGIYVTNDQLEAWEGTVHWSLETLDGKALTSGTALVKAAPQAATQVSLLDFGKQISDDNQRNVVFVAELWQGDRREALQVATFAPVKHLALRAPGVTANLSSEAGQLSINVASDTLAMVLELSLAGADVVFSDNYFNLPAGRTMTVTCPLPEGWTLAQAREALKLRSICDSYAGNVACVAR
jgi:beta-mannosidase